MSNRSVPAQTLRTAKLPAWVPIGVGETEPGQVALLAYYRGNAFARYTEDSDRLRRL